MSYVFSKNPHNNTFSFYRVLSGKNSQSSTNLEIMESGKGVYDYKYVRLQIDSPDTQLQFSNMFFQTHDGIKYIYPDNFNCWVKYNNKIQSGKQENGIFYGSEKFSNVLNNTMSMNKVCCGKTRYTCPIYFYIDLTNNPLNIKRYSYWGWHTSNDTTGPSGEWRRNLKKFSISVSNSVTDITSVQEEEWETVSDCELSDYDRQFTYGTNLPAYAYAQVGPFKIQKILIQ